MQASSDIFKLIFHHDQRLNELDHSGSSEMKTAEATLSDFMKPDPTYSHFYLAGTDLSNQKFGLDQLSAFRELIHALEESFKDHSIYNAQGKVSGLMQELQSMDTGKALAITQGDVPSADWTQLHKTKDSTEEIQKKALKKAIEEGIIILYKEESRDGFDLRIYSQKNIYPSLFYPLQKLLPSAFRFFSINGKKLRTERHFYFETWTLDRPPHGFEEVFPETVL